MKSKMIVSVLKFFTLFMLIFLSSPMQCLSQTSNVICNPLNIEYRFMVNEPSRREAADPTIVLFKNQYILFVSKSGGFWLSDDLINWKFHTNKQLSWEDYAPTAFVMNDSLYFMASANRKIYKTNDVLADNWEVCGEIDIVVTDPCLFYDNEKVYLAFGSSSKEPLKIVELDKYNKFKFKTQPSSIIAGNAKEHGFERPGNNNEGNGNPYLEGTWMTKYNNQYYLQYAAPGTQFTSYADGVYIADSITGPYHYQTNNPVSSKPAGFINGAGHGATFQDKYGNYWHIATSVISVKHFFERRLCLFPAFFDKNNVFWVNTSFGDYPFAIPTKKIAASNTTKPLWNLLSYNKKITVSSSLDSIKIKPENAVDENIKTWWSAKSSKDEWIKIDLGSSATVNAVQLNFKEENTTIIGTTPTGKLNKYKILYSADENTWDTAVAYADNATTDKPHPFHQFKQPIKARFIRIDIKEVTDGLIALSDCRVFGKMNVEKTKPIKQFSITRNTTDRRSVTLSWKKQKNAVGYEINYGNNQTQLYHSYMVYNNDKVTINSLNTMDSYWFTIHSFNEAGITKSTTLQKVE